MDRRASISASGFELDAAIVAAVFRISPEEIMSRIRDGKLTTLCEKGIDEDQGRHRLTFFLASRQARFVIDDTGTVLHSFCVDFGDRQLPRRRGATAGKASS